MSRVSLEANPRGGRRITWGRKDEEYCADFILVSKRCLSAGEWKLFRYHFLLGADAGLCARQLKTDRKSFYYAIYRIMEKVGKTFRELKPYALYPLDEYFNGKTESWWETAGEEAAMPPAEGFRSHSLSDLLNVPVKTAA
jgi:hypothetical protein